MMTATAGGPGSESEIIFTRWPYHSGSFGRRLGRGPSSAAMTREIMHDASSSAKAPHYRIRDGALPHRALRGAGVCEATPPSTKHRQNCEHGQLRVQSGYVRSGHSRRATGVLGQWRYSMSTVGGGAPAVP